jgi:hypothetical protein
MTLMMETLSSSETSVSICQKRECQAIQVSHRTAIQLSRVSLFYGACPVSHTEFSVPLEWKVDPLEGLKSSIQGVVHTATRDGPAS